MNRFMHRRRFLSQLAKTVPGVILGSSLLASVLSASESTRYTVRRGDTLSLIATRHGVTVAALRAANSLRGDHIQVGQVLTIPAAGASVASEPLYHTVVRGDTLSGIASQYGVTLAALRSANALRGDTIMIGQRLLVPGVAGSGAGYRYINNVVAATNRLRIPRDRWQVIVGHHSGIDRGNAAVYDRAHRRRRMENGLAYHFVIGNGKDSGDGEVEIGGRWLNQIDGGHVRNHAINQIGIGICVIGNFENERPTAAQMAAFRELTVYLRDHVMGGKCRFAVHREIDRNHTVCPGRHFPTREMHRLLG